MRRVMKRRCPRSGRKTLRGRNRWNAGRASFALWTRQRARGGLLYNRSSIAGCPPFGGLIEPARRLRPLPRTFPARPRTMLHTFVRVLGLLAACAAGLIGAVHANEAGDVAALFASGKRTEAFAQLDKLLAERPRDAQLRFLKGVLLSDSERPDEAAQVFEELTVDFPEMPEPYNNLAVIRAARGEY